MGILPMCLPPAAHGSINGMKVLMGVLLLVIAIAAITGRRRLSQVESRPSTSSRLISSPT